MHRPKRTAILLAIGLQMSLLAQAQSAPATRAEQIEAQRREKAATLKPEEVTPLERRLRNFRDQKYMERFAQGYHGFRLKVGNMVTGSGFAIGPEYHHENLLRGQADFRASAQISTRNYQKFESVLTLPRLANNRLAAELYASHRNYASLQYYGTGPDTAKEFRTNYRLEDTNFEGMLGVRPAKHLLIGGTTGYLMTNVGPGTDSRFASTETAYTAATTPGIDRQPNFLRSSVFAQYDYRNSPTGPKQGGNYVLQYSWLKDQTFSAYSFRRLDAEVQQYIGFLNRTRVIALRARTTLTDTDAGNQVPFYLQPVLGGSDDLRGYRFFRFTDRNSFVMNAEYRWEIFSGLDGAVFADAGKVFPRRGMLNFRDLESSVGVGLRFNARNTTVFRVDAGFSHEGFQVWIKFNDAFLPRRFGANSGQPIY